MILKVNLKDINSCNGCPCLDHIEQTGTWECRYYDILLEDGLARPKKCKEEEYGKKMKCALCGKEIPKHKKRKLCHECRLSEEKKHEGELKMPGLQGTLARTRKWQPS